MHQVIGLPDSPSQQNETCPEVHLLELLRNTLAADTILSGDTKVVSGIVGSGAVIAGFNITATSGPHPKP